jgi:SAM-dependent methyltransferase
MQTIMDQGRHPAMLQTISIDLLRCARVDPIHGRCLGRLHEANGALDCEECGARYPIVCGVPVLKSERDVATESWFEAHYEGRSRTKDLASDYLASERAFVGRFAAQHALKGPCLEVGCGTGCFAEIVPGYIGLDYSLTSLTAEGFESAARVCGDARRLPFEDSAMECVFSFNALEHVEDVALAFAEIDRVLRPGGYLVLKPAWHCAKYVTELIPVRSYSELNNRQRLTKVLLPLLRSKPYKFVSRVPWRVVRRIMSRTNNPLSYGRLTPYHGESWISDADAAASIDCHEAILYYTSRGYTCVSHPTAVGQLLAGHDLVVLRKQERRPAGKHEWHAHTRTVEAEVVT